MDWIYVDFGTHEWYYYYDWVLKLYLQLVAERGSRPLLVPRSGPRPHGGPYAYYWQSCTNGPLMVSLLPTRRTDERHGTSEEVPPTVVLSSSPTKASSHCVLVIAPHL